MLCCKALPPKLPRYFVFYYFPCIIVECLTFEAYILHPLIFEPPNIWTHIFIIINGTQEPINRRYLYLEAIDWIEQI